MTKKQMKRRETLNRKWACGTATREEIKECMALDRQFRIETGLVKTDEQLQREMEEYGAETGADK